MNNQIKPWKRENGIAWAFRENPLFTTVFTSFILTGVVGLMACFVFIYMVQVSPPVTTEYVNSLFATHNKQCVIKKLESLRGSDVVNIKEIVFGYEVRKCRLAGGLQTQIDEILGALK